MPEQRQLIQTEFKLSGAGLLERIREVVSDEKQSRIGV
jgi:hypothetical protein